MAPAATYVKIADSPAHGRRTEDRLRIVADKKDNLPTDIDALTESTDVGAGGGLRLTDMVGAGLNKMLSGLEPSLEGERIGAYRIVRTIGRGGMGAVFLAERDDRQYTQRVAIKVVSDITLSPEILGRFIGERQILAKLDHPYIAHLIDGGETDSGVPYLVMEYVEGEPILEACRSLGIDERIDLFLKICEAVQFAHQNLIVHRDIKPGNILVSADGIPKLLDFGIAKILDPLQFDQTLIQTQDGQRLLTPEHAAPEQVLGQPVTTATDVYCLGILLYQLLTGTRPYSLEGTRRGELERIICEQPSPLPSSRVTRSLADEANVPLPAPPERLRKRLRGDLDNIILKALRKEPERRYASVNEFAEDIRRHRRGLPVSARPDTWAYRSSKFIQRHRYGVATFVTLVALLSGFAVYSNIQSQRIERERQAAVREKQTAEAALSFLIDMFRSVDPGESRGRDVDAATLVSQASGRIETQLDGQPAVQATLMNTIGVVYYHLGDFDSAMPMLDAAVDRREGLADDPEALIAYRNDLGAVYIEQAHYDEAAQLFARALEDARAYFSTDHHEIARALLGQGTALQQLRDYDAAEPLLREALDIDRRVLDSNDPRLADTITGYATIMWRRNQLDEARAGFEEALGLRRRLLGSDHFETIEAVNNLAAVLIDAGNHDAAEPLFREALQLNEKVLGPEHPTVAINLNNLGYVLRTTGRFAEAENVYRRALAIETVELGSDHPDLAYSLNSLAQILTRTGKLDEADQFYRRALDVMRAEQGEDFEHRLTGQVLANYSILLGRQGRDEEAYERAAMAREKIDAEYPPEHWRRAFAASVLGATLARLGRIEQARPLIADSIAPIETSMGADSVFARDARARLELLTLGE